MKDNLKKIVLLLTIVCFNISFAKAITEKKIVINSDTLSYYDSEKGKITLLFIHGSFINKEYWENQISYFSPEYRVVALDLAGHGNSTRNRNEWTVRKFGDDIREIIYKLSLEKVILIGHSIGGDIMLEATNENSSSIIGIIGIDYFKNIGFELPQNIIEQVITNLKTDFASTNEQYVRHALLTTKTNKAIESRVLANFKTMNPNVGIAMNEDFLNYSNRETCLLKNMDSKLYLINVNYSPTNEESLKQLVGDNYELKIMNGTCHFPMIENPKELNIMLEETVLKIKQQTKN